MSLPQQLSILLTLLVGHTLCGQDLFRIDHLITQLEDEDRDTARCRIMFEIAVELGGSDTVLALEYLNRGKSIAFASGSNNVLGNYYLTRGKINAYHGAYQLAIASFDSALSCFSEAKNNLEYFGTIKEKGNIFLRVSQYDRAMELYEKALQFYRNNGIPLGMSRCLNNMGIIHKNRGEYVEALSLYEESVLYLDPAMHSKDISQGYLNMGNVFVLLGSYDRALEYFEMTRDIAETENDTRTLALCLSNSGVVQNKCHNYAEADRMYEQSLKVSRRINDRVQISNCLINIGTNKADMGEPEEGLKFVRQGLAIKEDLHDLRTISNCYIHMAEIHSTMDELDKAVSLFRKAIPEKINLGDKDGLIRAYLGIAAVDMKTADYQEAEANCDLAISIASEIHAMEHLVSGYRMKMDLAEARGNFPSAFIFAKLFDQYRDSLLNEATTKAAMEIQFRNRSRALEQENENLRLQSRLSRELMQKRNAFLYSLLGIAVLLATGLLLVAYFLRRLSHSSAKLEEKNLVITRQNLKLDRMNRTKDRMMSIIAHDLRGTIGNQLMAVEVLHRLENQPNPEMDRAKLLGNLKHSAAYSLELLENLLHWSRLEENESLLHPEEVDVDNLIQNCLSLFTETAANKGISFSKQILDTPTCRADRIMLETIIRNLISNAIKFSHPGSEVGIFAGNENGEVTIKVTDHGIGMTSEEIRNVMKNSGFTKRGTSNEKGAGIGLTLVREFSTMHNGQLHIESRPGTGSVFTVTIPSIN